MHHPAHINGCSIVLLARVKNGFVIEDSGFLSFDGSVLEIQESGRQITDIEQIQIKHVVLGNLIKQTSGFQLFLVVNE